MSGGLDRFSVRASLAQEFLMVRSVAVIEDQDKENFRVLRSHSDTSRLLTSSRAAKCSGLRNAIASGHKSNQAQVDIHGGGE